MNQRVGRILSRFATLWLLLFSSLFAFAGPGKTTYQAKIVKPDGYPLEVSNVNFKFTILDPAGSCILYSETYSSVNMSGTGGLISFALGSGVKVYPASATTFAEVFSNITPSLSCDTGGPVNYSPAASDIRKIVMQFHDGSGWQTLPAMSINAVPYAMYANEATKLNGLTSSDFVQLSTVPTCTASEALRYTGASFSCVAVGNSVTSGTVVTALGYTPADGVSVTALSSSLTTTNATVSSVSSTVFSVSSTVTSLQNSVAASFAAITSSQWTTSGTNIFYNTGSIGIGTTTPVTTLDVSGGVRIGTESTTCAPALAGTLRYNASNVEYCNGTSWQAFGVSGAGITNFNGSTSGTQSFTTGTGGTAPNFNTSNGVHTLNIPLASTGSVTAGLLSNADYTTFTNKITSSAASIAQVLGYVPADNAASGTYAQKANNLSDLINIATARTNLGLGTFATASSIDLGSASATGTLAIARLPSFTGDATIASASNTIILSNSGVTAGTHTKVTVDSKGRVTSSAALASSDVTAALGYTPANSATITSSQWTTSGTNIYYNAGNVGIGTSNPEFKLSLLTDAGVMAQGAYGSGATLVTSGSGTRMFWYPRKAAFRAGEVDGSQWDDANVGSYSAAFGFRTVASGWYSFAAGEGSAATDDYAVAFGSYSNASGYNSFAAGEMNSATNQYAMALGTGNIASGYTSIAMGKDVTADSYSQITVGRNNMPKGGENPNSWIWTDPIFVVGNGTGTGASRSTAMMILKNGNIGIGTTTPTAKLHLAAGTSSTAALKFTSGTLLTSPQSGTMEYDGTNFYLTDSTNTRRAIAANTNPGTYDNVSNINSSGNITLTPTGSVVVSSTTASTNSSTGALVVKGGLGVAGDIYTSGTIVTSSNIQGVSITATSGMISPYIAGSVVSGGSLTLDSTTHATKGNILLAPNGGNVGIGTTTPDHKMRVVGKIKVGTETDNVSANMQSDVNDVFELVSPNTASAPAMSFHHRGLHTVQISGFGSSVTNQGLRIKSGPGEQPAQLHVEGKVGIGTSSPTNTLDVLGAGLTVTRNQTFGTLATFNKAYTSANNEDPYMQFRHQTSDGGSYNRYGYIQSGQSHNGLLLQGENGAGSPSYLLLNKFGGNVGIGTSTPGGPLEVVGGNTGTAYSSGEQTLILRNNSSTIGARGAGIRFDNGSFTGGGAQIDFINSGTTNEGHLSFGTRYGGTIAERVRIQDNGNVGIGTISPASKLTVAGGQIRSEAAAVDTDLARIPGNSEIVIETAGDGITSSWLWREKWAAANYGVFHDNSADNVIFVGNNSPRLSVGLSSGNVGIGTSTPTQKLDVVGTVKATAFAGDGSQLTNIPGSAIQYNEWGSGWAGGAVPWSTYSYGMSGWQDYTGTATGLSNFWTGWTTRNGATGAQIAVNWNVEAGSTGGVKVRAKDDTGGNWGTWRDLAFTDASVQKSGDSMTGSLAIGTAAAPGYTLDVNGDIRITGTPWRASGDIAWTVPSDARLKDVKRIYDRGLKEILNIDTIIYTYKKGNIKQIDPSMEFTGVLAQNVQAHIPEAVKEDKDGFLSLNTTPIFWAMINAVKDLYHEITGVQREIASLKEENKAKDQEIKVLKERLDRIEKALQPPKAE